MGHYFSPCHAFGSSQLEPLLRALVPAQCDAAAWARAVSVTNLATRGADSLWAFPHFELLAGVYDDGKAANGSDADVVVLDFDDNEWLDADGAVARTHAHAGGAGVAGDTSAPDEQLMLAANEGLVRKALRLRGAPAVVFLTKVG